MKMGFFLEFECIGNGSRHGIVGVPACVKQRMKRVYEREYVIYICTNIDICGDRNVHMLRIRW